MWRGFSGSGRVTAKTMTCSASGPAVMKFFDPLSTKEPSPCLSATVSMVRASEPLVGSVRPKQPSILPAAVGARISRCWCSVPNLSKGSQKSELLTLMITPELAQAALISSTTSA